MSTRDRSLVAVVILIVIAIGGYFVVVAPAHSTANRLSAQIATAHTSVQQAESQVQAGQTAEAQYNSYANQLTSLSHAVPADEQIPELINELQAASTRTKVGFESVSTSASAVTAPTTATTATTGAAAITFPSQTFTLSFTGSYFAVANLLGELASYVHADDRHFDATGRLLSISSVSLSPGGGTSTSSTHPGDVTASVSALDYDLPSTTTTATTG